MGLTRLGAVLVALVAGAALLVAPAAAAPERVTATQPPLVKGDPVFDGRLVAGTGHWDPAAVSLAYQWLRAGQPVPGATERTYVPGLDDLGRRIRVEVTATDAAGESATSRSEPTDPVRRASFVTVEDVRLVGEARYGSTLRMAGPRLRPRPERVIRYWMADGVGIAHADGRTYRIRPGDVGTRVLGVTVASRPGYRKLESVTEARTVRHRIDVRRTVSYHVETRGHVTASVADFRRLAQQTYDDPRGWRGAGIAFRRVAHGGDFTLVLAEASRVPGFSSSCSSSWSCRVGRFVIINQTRWLHASPAWNAAHGTLRDYRHMVVNHETGHWLGLGHAGCPRRGALAPVMMQQSKGLGGCRFNPWPTGHELAGRTPH